MISLIDFTHSFPLIDAISSRTEIDTGTPAGNLEGILDGKYSMAMVSLVSYLENSEDLELIRGANIHSRAQTLSTILVSRGKDLADEIDVAVTSHTKTTEFYMDQVLSRLGISCNKIHGKATESDDLLDMADFALVIGDEALRFYNGNGKIIFDIGFEFSHLFRLEPIYAVTVARKGEVDKGEVADLDFSVEASRNYIKKSINRAAGERNIDKNIMAYYYDLISYQYGSEIDRTVEFVSGMSHSIKP